MLFMSLKTCGMIYDHPERTFSIRYVWPSRVRAGIGLPSGFVAHTLEEISVCPPLRHTFRMNTMSYPEHTRDPQCAFQSFLRRWGGIAVVVAYSTDPLETVGCTQVERDNTCTCFRHCTPVSGRVPHEIACEPYACFSYPSKHVA